MDPINSASSGRRPTSDDEYDRPLPGAARKDAINVASSPWLSDATPRRTPAASPPPPPSLEGPTSFPAAIFSNPAMLGPPVSLAPPPAPATSKAAPLLAAPNALHGVTITTLAGDLPSGTRTDTTRAFTCGAGYKLYPEVAKQADGRDAIVYWKAFDTQERRVDFLIGPDALKTFTSAPSDFKTAAANAYLGEQDAATRESMRVVDLAVKQGFGPAIRHLPAASAAAWSDPKWVAKTVFQSVSAIGPSAEVAAQSRLARRAAAAEAAMGEVGEVGFVEHVNKDLPLGKVDGDRAFNCGNCVVATDATMAGRPASAVPGVVTKPEELESLYGKPWANGVAAPGEIEASMRAAGDGARGIVNGRVPNQEIGHVFNVVNKDGVIHFVDGQTGTVADLTRYDQFWLLRTN